MKRPLLTLSMLLLVALSGCLAQPSDEEQIRTVADRVVSAINREDWSAAYRQTDLDFRATCTEEQFIQGMRYAVGDERPLRLERLDSLTIAHIRASTTLSVSSPSGTREIALQFIRDGGRWYLYVPEC